MTRALSISVVAGIAAALLRHQIPAVAFLLWLVAIALPLATLARGEGRDHGGWIATAIIVAIGAFFRLYAIGRLPYGYFIDEASTVLNGVANAGRFDPFGWTPLLPWRPDWVRTSNLYLSFAHACFAAGGFTHLGVKFVSVLPAIATTVVVARMARSFVAAPYALFAGGAFAVSAWDVTISRWGWDEVLATLLLTSAFALLMRVSERASFGAGVLSGLAQYAYASSRAGAAAAVSFVLLSAITKRRSIPAAIAFAVGLVVTIAPQIAEIVQAPATFAARAEETSILRTPSPASTAAQTALATALMFNVRGGHNPRHNVPDRAELELIPGLLFLAGIAVLIGERSTDRARLLLLWLASGLVLGILTLPAPHPYRLGFLAPACFLIAAAGLERLARSLTAPRAVALSAAIVVISIITTYRSYFIERDRCRICWLSNREGALAHVGATEARSLIAQHRALAFDAAMRTPEWDLERLLIARATGVVIPWVDPRVAPPDFSRVSLITVPPGNRLFPPGIDPRQVAVLTNPFGDRIVAVTR